MVLGDRFAQQAPGDREMDTGQHVGRAHRRDDVHIVVVAQRYTRAFDPEERHGVPKNEAEHFAQPQRLANRARDICQGLRLSALAFAFRVATRVRHGGRGLRTHRRQHLLIVSAEDLSRCRVHRQHANEVNTGQQRNSKHRRRRTRIAHHIVG